MEVLYSLNYVDVRWEQQLRGEVGRTDVGVELMKGPFPFTDSDRSYRLGWKSRLDGQGLQVANRLAKSVTQNATGLAPTYKSVCGTARIFDFVMLACSSERAGELWIH